MAREFATFVMKVGDFVGSFGHESQHVVDTASVKEAGLFALFVLLV
jgi:hypothetical protein